MAGNYQKYGKERYIPIKTTGIKCWHSRESGELAIKSTVGIMTYKEILELALTLSITSLKTKTVNVLSAVRS